jgi:hypothetical protein
VTRLLVLAVLLLAACASTPAREAARRERAADLAVFHTWGREPASDRERSDARECIALTVALPAPASSQAGAAASFVLLGPLLGPAVELAVNPAARERASEPSRWRTCMRERGHNLGEWQLTPEGKWVQR